MKKVLVLLFLSQNLLAQKVNLSIRVFDDFTKPVIGATVVLKSHDFQLSNFTDTTGLVSFKLKEEGAYLLKISSVGFENIEKEIEVSIELSAFKFNLIESNNRLDEVKVTAKRSFIRQEDDKTIIDPEAIANTTTNALELLERTPGLFVDPSGSVYLNSATPASIYINGREQKMSATDVSNILKSLPPGSIEKIEIIRTPSASMDASSTGGSINIVLKKGVKLGRTGSISAGVNQGSLGNQFVRFNVSRSQEKKSSYFNISFSGQDNFNASSFERTIPSNLISDNILETSSYSNLPSYSISSGYGVNMDFSKKLEFSYDGRLSYNQSNNALENKSKIYNLSDVSKVLSQNINTVENERNGYSVSQGVFGKYKLDEKGSEIKLDVSLNYIETEGNQDYLTRFTLPMVQSISGFGNFKSTRNLYAFQADFKYYFPGKVTFESGLKFSIQNFRNNTAYEKSNLGEPTSVIDEFRTSKFTYFENINAAYLQASKMFGEYVLKLGTRLENTQMRGQQLIPSDTTFRINRTDLFPYVYFSRKLVTIANYDLRGYLVARRTIQRPGYSDLNPFPRFVDQYIYETGNPSLKPQFTKNYEANISFQEMPILAFGQNYTSDIFNSVVYQDKTDPLVSYRTTDNLGKRKETYFNIIGAIPPGGKYFFVVGAQFSRNEYEGLIDNKPFSFDRSTWSFFTYHQLKLDKLSTLTLNGFYRTKGQLQFYELSNFGNLRMSINRQFFKKKLAVTLYGSDILYTSRYNFVLNQGDINGTGSTRTDSRRIGININYSFGQKKKQEANFNFGELLKE